jgi:hypothetical protein
MVALDSTMFEPHAVSRYFDKRRKFTACQARKSRQPQRANRLRAITNARMPKLSLAIQASSHLILAACATIGMDCDHSYFAALACQAKARFPLDTLLADKGYDGEANHVLAREHLGLRTLIPVRACRQGSAGTTGYYRKLMQRCFQSKQARRHYRQRWQVETVNSMVKRNLGSACRARSGRGRKKELLLRVITHNLMILANL